MPRSGRTRGCGSRKGSERGFQTRSRGNRRLGHLAAGGGVGGARCRQARQIPADSVCVSPFAFVSDCDVVYVPAGSVKVGTGSTGLIV